MLAPLLTHCKLVKRTEEKALCPRPWVSGSSISRTRKRMALFECGPEQSSVGLDLNRKVTCLPASATYTEAERLIQIAFH